MTKPVEWLAALKVGTVESVSPSEIKVLLEIDAPQTTALNTGVPSGFPRINSYVLIPNEAGAVVGLVTWLGIEHSNFPKRTGFKDFGLIDLPYPLRKMTLTPLGTLIHTTLKGKKGLLYRLERGVSVFPSVGDSVLLPTDDQLRSIVESEGKDRRVLIGTSPLAGNAEVSVDPDKLFGRHLAVLGNTGSGKSCTVAGLIRWSLQAAKNDKAANKRGGEINARFIILDPNGEYSAAFADMPGKVRIFRVPPAVGRSRNLLLPAWMWNSHEWAAFASAAPGTQRPLLLNSLREMRAGKVLREPIEMRLSRRLRTYKAKLEERIAAGLDGYRVAPLLTNIVTDSQAYCADLTGTLQTQVDSVGKKSSGLLQNNAWQNKKGFNDFSEHVIRDLVGDIQKILDNLPKIDLETGPSEDSPTPFDVTQLPDHLEEAAVEVGSGQIAQFISTLTMRIRMMLADRRLGPIVRPEDDVSFEGWLKDYVGASSSRNGQIAILDLSLVPADVVHIIISVVARIVFEAVQRYRKLSLKELPTVLVLEEAHTFVHRGAENEEGIPTPAQMCRQTFERIAREGRKFGLGLVLSSQRPSELSPTVLAQCNTFILHRIVNDKDQELVGKLVPDNLGGLLRELPSLPARQAILLGWATAVPVLVEVLELAEKYRPRSSDPKFWDVWTGVESRRIDWAKIAKDWTT